MFEKRHRMKRVSDELIQRIEEYRRKQQKPQSFVEATRDIAETAILPNDKLNEGINRIGKKWRFRV